MPDQPRLEHAAAPFVMAAAHGRPRWCAASIALREHPRSSRQAIPGAPERHGRSAPPWQRQSRAQDWLHFLPRHRAPPLCRRQRLAREASVAAVASSLPGSAGDLLPAMPASDCPTPPHRAICQSHQPRHGQIQARAVVRDQPPQRPPPNRAGIGRRYGQNGRWPFDHHLTQILGGITNQRHRTGDAGFREMAHPLRTSTGLAEPASSHQQPDPPVTGRRHLAMPRPEWPGINKSCSFTGCQ